MSNKAKKINEDIIDVSNMVTEKKVDYKTYSKTIILYNYDLSKETVISTLVTMVIYVLYFTIYPVLNYGQTIGKKLLKLKIINNDKKEKLTTNNLLIRELILHGILFDLIMTILILFVSKKTYMYFNTIIGVTEMIIYIVILFMIIIRKDGRGLHDLLGNTKVINEEVSK